MQRETAMTTKHALSILAIKKEDVFTAISNLKNAHLKHNAKLLMTV